MRWNKKELSRYLILKLMKLIYLITKNFLYQKINWWAWHIFLFHLQSLDWHFVTYLFTAFWGPGNHSKLTPGGRPMFLKPRLHKESKNGFKTIHCCPYPVLIFSENYFFANMSSKKLDILLIFEFLRQYTWIS